jgi:hypothetical protein
MDVTKFKEAFNKRFEKTNAAILLKQPDFKNTEEFKAILLSKEVLVDGTEIDSVIMKVDEEDLDVFMLAIIDKIFDIAREATHLCATCEYLAQCTQEDKFPVRVMKKLQQVT